MKPRSRCLGRSLSLFLLAAPLAAFCQSAAPPPPTPPPTVRYRVTDLGLPSGASDVMPEAVNDLGEVVGSSQIGGTQPTSSGFQWTEAQGMKDLGTLAGVSIIPIAINNQGQFVGKSSGHPIISLKGGDAKALADVSGTAFAVNDLGQVTGNAVSVNAADHAFLWSVDKGMQDLGVLPGYTKSRGMGINSQGEVAGSLYSADYVLGRAFFWRQGVMQDLGTLGGRITDAHSLNDSGQVVGTSYVADKTFHGFLWQKGRMEDLGAQSLTLLPGAGGPNSEAESINNRGQIVGTATDDHGTNIACFWENGQIYDLNSLIPAEAGWHLVFAAHINALGQIVGYGSLNGTENYHGFLLTPLVPQAPEPAEATPPAPSAALPAPHPAPASATPAKASKAKKPAVVHKAAKRHKRA